MHVLALPERAELDTCKLCAAQLTITKTQVIPGKPLFLLSGSQGRLACYLPKFANRKAVRHDKL